jgi:hypothetical protein
MIAAAPDGFFGYFLDLWATVPAPAEVRAAYLDASRAAVPSIVADYRASATTDVAHDHEDLAQGNKLTMPVTVIQQVWGSALGFDSAARWRAWTTDLEHRTTTAGHFMAEESPRGDHRGDPRAGRAMTKGPVLDGSGPFGFSLLSGLEEGALEVVVHGVLRHPERTTYPHRGQLTGVHQPVHRHLGHAHGRGDLRHGQELHLGKRLLTTGLL